MGQGINTALTMILADELDLDWKKIKTEFAPAAPAYFNPVFGLQGTGGSTSIRGSWEPLAKAGAAAREMLVATAAKRWNVEPSACHTENSAVVNTASGKRIGYGALVEEAAKMPLPANPKRKDAKEYKYVGKATKRIDSKIKVNGTAEFGIDVRRPKMLHAAVARCPVFRGTVKSFDGTQAKAVPGVKSVVQVSTGTAFAFVPSKLFTVPRNTGHRATAAWSIFGRRTSIPNSAVPFTFILESIRFVAFPTYLYSFASFRFGFAGTGIFAASSTSAPYPMRLPEAVFTTALFSVWHALGSTFHRFAAVATSISRAAAPAFASGSHDPRMLVLPPVPCNPKTGLKYAGAAGANSVLIFFQSRSNSSARIMVSAVLIPWPI